ncbi:MAG: YfjI family protein [Acetobacteraceae bacterium]|jgi:hypothetical protein|nr:YfjI family protein [Acetobacteraceae bacterium]
MADGFTVHDAVLPLPSVALLRDRRSAPAFPVALLGPVWAKRIAEAAEAKNAPPDYIAAGLLAGAAACIGNARWATVWQGWNEPPFLWFGVVGNPSSGKSPGLSATLADVLPPLEEALATDYPEKLAEWERLAAEAKAIRAQWEGEVKTAVKQGTPAPCLPDRAREPPRPCRPRIVTNESTIEALALLLRDNARGLLLHRDELAAFLGGFDRYGNAGGGGERAAWLEAYVGAFKAVDRVKNPEPIIVPRFALGIVGTIQPDRLADLTSSADDGLAVRFLWTFPEARPFARPKQGHDAAPWQRDMGRLLRLEMPKGEGDKPRPWYVPFSRAAAAVVEDAANEWAQREANASGLMLGALGKARGQMVRLALVQEHLRWCAEVPGDPPSEVGEAAATAAAALMDGYFLPMADRAFGGALSQAERHARTLLRHIVATRAEVVNERAIRETPGLPGLSAAEAVKQAVAVLMRDDVLLAVPHEPKPGRPRLDHRVNPRLAEAIAVQRVAA